MTFYLLGYLAAFALTLYSTYLEYKWFHIAVPTRLDVLLALVASLLSWFWFLVATIFTAQILLKKYKISDWLEKPIFKKPH